MTEKVDRLRLNQSLPAVKGYLELSEKGTNLEGLVSAFLTAIEGFSVWEAEEMTGVNHETVAKFRRGERPKLHYATRRKMQTFIDDRAVRNSQVYRETVKEPAGQYGPGQETVGETMHRAGLLIAADRLEQMAAKLRAEATTTVKGIGRQILKEFGAEALPPGSPRKPADPRKPAPARRPRKRPKRGPGGRAAGE